MTRDRTVLVVGATGLVGNAILNELLDDGSIQSVIALTRRPLRRNHPRLVQRVTDYAGLDALRIERLDAVFCALGTTIAKAGNRQAFREVDHDLPLRLAAWGQTKGASHYLLVSSVGASPDSRSFYLRVKGELERDLAALGYGSLDIFQPSLLLGPRQETRTLEAAGKVLAQLFQWVLLGELSRYRPVRARDLAAAMAEAARRNEPGLRRHQYDSIRKLGTLARS